jgi:hypothetical protein
VVIAGVSVVVSFFRASEFDMVLLLGRNIGVGREVTRTAVSILDTSVSSDFEAATLIQNLKILQRTPVCGLCGQKGVHGGTWGVAISFCSGFSPGAK